MSRYTQKLSTIETDSTINKELIAIEAAWGYDAFCGFFFQLLNEAGDALVDIDSRFHSLSGPELADKLEENDVHIHPYHRACMMMDMPF